MCNTLTDENLQKATCIAITDRDVNFSRKIWFVDFNFCIQLKSQYLDDYAEYKMPIWTESLIPLHLLRKQVGTEEQETADGCSDKSGSQLGCGRESK